MHCTFIGINFICRPIYIAYFCFVVGFLIGPQLKKYGSKPIAIGGAILSAVGFVISMFVTNLRIMYFTYAFLSGKPYCQHIVVTSRFHHTRIVHKFSC